MIELSPLLWGSIGLGVVIILLVLGVHIGLAMGIVGFLGMIVVTGHVSAGLMLLKTTPYAIGSLAVLVVLPLFILMGYLCLYSGISQGALQATTKWTGKLPGGLSLAVTWACVGFGAVSGSSIAAAAVFTKLASPEMSKAGYETKFALGSIATASVIAMLIPPSIFMVLYSMLAEESLARMLIAGTFPGLLLAITLSLGIVLMVTINPKFAPRVTGQISWRERVATLPQLWPMIALIVIVFGGIYSGVFVPTEAAAIAAVTALVFALARKGLTWANFKDSLLDTVKITAALVLILVGVNMLTRFLTVTGLVRIAAEAVGGMGLSSAVFLISIVVLYLILGCFMDTFSAMALTLPIFLPIIRAFGIDPIYFGVLVVASLSLGMITPPFGLVAFTTKTAAGPTVKLEDVFRGIIPHLGGALACLALLVAFPQISLFLPNTMFGAK